MNDECFLVEKTYYDAAREGPAGEEISDRLREIAAYNRINAMAAVAAARHGWIGACFSAAEIITVLYFAIADTGADDPRRDAVVLGKGHAAAMQYAALAGLGRIPVAALLQYKRPGGPQAHADMTTPGIDTNTGSLGQALSKCCGLAMAGRRRVFAVLGDGELQEGQNYEAVMTAVHYGLDNLTVIIDRNGIQSDSNVADVMDIGDPAAVFRAFGMNTVAADGNDIAALQRAVAGAAAAGVPTAVIAHTVKGRGVGFMESRDARRRAYAWHGRPPAGAAYLDALVELGGSLRNRTLAAEIASFVSARRGRPASPPRPRPAGMSTGEAFARCLVDVAMERPAIRVLDADLEKPCRLEDFARRLPGRLLEMGICEQDMVSCAGGLALGGEIPVVNTYAAFFRRAFEQVYVNATEQTRILYAGHYAGLCYTTDGRTHQCTGDIAMMRSIPGMAVLYPADPGELPGMLDWFLDEWEGPAYIRLHRTPAPPCGGGPFRYGRGRQVRDYGAPTAVVTCGPHTTRYCREAVDALAADGGPQVDLWTVSTLKNLDRAFVRELAGRYALLRVVEETIAAGGLRDELSGAMADLEREGLPSRPRIVHRAPRGMTGCTLDPEGCYRRFGLTADAVAAFIKETP